jgi:signal transduction histidine kinase
MRNNQIAFLDFIDKMEQVSQFQDKIDISSTINNIWDAFVDELRNFISIDACALFLVDEETHEFLFNSAVPGDKKKIFQQEVEYQIECNMFSWIINRRVPALIPSFVFKNEKSIIMLPLSTIKRTIGVVSVLTSMGENLITQEDLKLLTMLARQCSLVMENSILYNKLKKKHRDLERARDQIVSSEKMASIGRLTAGASHEILNPLTIISGQIQLMRMTSELNEKQKTVMDIVESQTNRISSIISGLEQFSKNGIRHRDKLDINDVVTEFVKSKQHDLKALKIDLVNNGDTPLPSIIGDKESLMKVLSHLLSNSLDAMHGGGTINISLREEKEGHGTDPNGDHVRISFLDSGNGIAEKDITRVMDPFFTTKNRSDRPGLGLSLCYGIIRDHGGTLRVLSAWRKGTEILIYLAV